MAKRAADRPYLDDTTTSDRTDLLRALKPAAAWAIAAALVAALVTLVLQVTSGPVYRAETTLLLTKSSAEGVPPQSQLLAPRLSIETYQATITTPSVLRAAYSQAPGQSAGSVVNVTVSDANQSGILRIGVRGDDPEDARQIADAVAEATIAWDVDRARDVAARNTMTLERQVADLRARRRDELPAVQAARLDQLLDERAAQLERSRTLEAAADSPLRVIQPAMTPSKPVSPRPVRNTVLVGLLTGMAVFVPFLLLRAARRD